MRAESSSEKQTLTQPRAIVREVRARWTILNKEQNEMSRTRFPLVAAVAVIVAAAVAVIVATSGASTTKRQPSVTAGSAISVKQTALGPTLVDANGRTLYLFEGDRPNVSTLSAAGQAIWPPFTATTTPRALSGALAVRIGTVTQPSGGAQVTYNGHPLYYYVGDHSPGQTSGQGLNQFGALWYVLGPRGKAVTSSASSSPASASGAGSSSYGY
jgi:predicted lipoprotein with Yx(FWY)xxD motif